MTMWLEEDQYDCKKDLMDLLMMNYDASSCLLVCTVLSILPVCYFLPMVWVFYADIGHLFLFYYYQLQHWSIFYFSGICFKLWNW